jgi:pilus assembly protein Flp/PilA
MRKIVLKLWKDEEGPTAVEYALMLFMIVGVVTAALTPLRQAVINAFNAARNALNAFAP